MQYDGIIPVTYTTGAFVLTETAPEKKAFHLLVGVAGAVVFDDGLGTGKTMNFVAGIHKVDFVKITQAGTTATGLGACIKKRLS